MEPKDPITNPPPPPSPPSLGAIKHEILKSIVFGDLNESITSLGVVTFATNADAATSACQHNFYFVFLFFCSSNIYMCVCVCVHGQYLDPTNRALSLAWCVLSNP